MMNKLKIEENQIMSELNVKRKRVEMLRNKISQAKSEKENEHKKEVLP